MPPKRDKNSADDAVEDCDLDDNSDTSGSGDERRVVRRLVMSSGDAPFIVVAGPDEAGVLTDVMNGCATVILLWDRDEATGDYNGMLAHHVAGAGDVPWRRYSEITTEAAIILMCAADQSDIDQALTYGDERWNAWLPDASLRTALFSNALVFRNGTYQPVTNSDVDETLYRVL